MTRQPTEVEIACDESGSDGENLTGGNTDVFAHGSVDVPMADASAAIREIRDRIRSPAEEYKANHLLREKHRAVLEWTLGPSGPLHGHAYVHLTEKTFFMVERVVDLLLGDPAGAAPLFRAGAHTFGDERWKAFLTASNALLRVRGDADADPGAPVDAFLRAVDALAEQAPDLRDRDMTDVADVLKLLGGARSRAADHRARLLAAPALIPVLNPLLPAIVRTAARWSAGGRAVTLVHDRQNMLTEERIEWLRETARIEGLRLVVARDDTRVQLADFLAGIARSIASHELNGRGDATLTALLRPYVASGASGSAWGSVWGDERSKGRLFGAVHS